MRRLRLLAYLGSLMVLPSTAAAQQWGQPWSDPRDRPSRVDVTAFAGGVVPTDWSDLVLLGTISPVTGVLEQVLVRDIRVKPDALYGASVTYWRGNHGARFQAGWSRSSLEIGGAPLSSDPAIDNQLSPPRIDSWFYDVRGAIGLGDYEPSRRVWPYAFVGFGGITYDLSRPVSPPLLTFIERPPPGGLPDIVIVEDDGDEFLLAIDELSLETVFSINFGVGADFRIPLGRGALGVRAEVSDNVSHSPVKLRIRELSAFTPGGLSDSVVRFGTVHHIRATVGFIVQFGK